MEGRKRKGSQEKMVEPAAGPQSSADPASDKRGSGIRLVPAIGATVVLGLLVMAFLVMKVCDEQLNNRGQAVSVCRHVELADPPMAALGIVLVGLIASAFQFDEFSAFGISLKKRVTQVESAVKAADKTATNAEQAAETASRTSLSADQVSKAAKEAAGYAKSTSLANEALLLTSRPEGHSRYGAQGVLDAREGLCSLARQYNQTRADEDSSRARSAKLTNIVADMVAVVKNAGPEALDANTALSDADMGMRLAAYAYLFALPEQTAVLELVNAVCSEPETHRFGQYWGLRAIRRQVQSAPDELDETSRRRLRELPKLRSIGNGTDRAYELREILRISPGKHGVQAESSTADTTSRAVDDPE